MKFKKGDKVVWRPRPGSDWDYPSKLYAGVPPTGTRGTIYSEEPIRREGWTGVHWDCNDPDRSFGFPLEYLELYVEPQAGIPWIYPDGSEEWKEGDEIICNFIAIVNLKEFPAGSETAMKLTRVLFSTLGNNNIYAWKYGSYGYLRDEDIKLLAYVPYTKPNPPEKPQNCPFCGSKMEVDLSHLGKTYWYRCDRCTWSTPPAKTKEEAVKTLNSVKVVKE